MAHTPTVDTATDVDLLVRDHPTKPLTDLLAVATELLVEDQDLGLLAHYLTVDRHGRIGVQLTDQRPALFALANVATTHGGVITAHPHVDADGRTVIHCEVHFPYRGVQVEAYAFVARAA
jgi:hypothetical protein